MPSDMLVYASEPHSCVQARVADTTRGRKVDAVTIDKAQAAALNLKRFIRYKKQMGHS